MNKRESPPDAWQSIFIETKNVTSTGGSTHVPRAHDSVEITLVLSGGGLHHLFGKSVPCGQGEVYILPSHVSHFFSLCAPSDRLVIRTLRFRPAEWFDGDVRLPDSPRYCYGIFRGGMPLAYARLTSNAHSEVLSLTDAIAREQKEALPEYPDAVRSCLALLLITVGRYAGTAIRTAPDPPARECGIVSSALRMIEEGDGTDDLTLESLSGALFVSPSHLSRSFKKYMGQSFSEFLRHYRLDRACRLLAETDAPIADIVRAVGLKDVPSFYRAFENDLGMTPHQYRLRARQHGAGQNHQQTGETTMSILHDIAENLQLGKAKAVRELVEQALSEGIDAKTILEDGLICGMNVIGEKFKNNEIYIPEVLIAARALNVGTQMLKPYFGEAGLEPIGRVCIGTVEGDLHDIGKNLVKMMMEGKQLEVIDLGTDVPAETFVRTAIEENCQIICCSALLTTTMGVMEDVVQKLREAGASDKIKVMIGGAPVSEDYCRKIGADIYTVDAASAADAAVKICLAQKG